MTPIYVDNKTPGAEQCDALVVAWTAVCHERRFIYIRHERLRDTSRWTCVDRKRPFLVTIRLHHDIGSSATLAGALKIARLYQAGLTPAKAA